jgi:hypothetical protein
MDNAELKIRWQNAQSRITPTRVLANLFPESPACKALEHSDEADILSHHDLIYDELSEVYTCPVCAARSKSDGSEFDGLKSDSEGLYCQEPMCSIHKEKHPSGDGSWTPIELQLRFDSTITHKGDGLHAKAKLCLLTGTCTPTEYQLWLDDRTPPPLTQSTSEPSEPSPPAKKKAAKKKSAKKKGKQKEPNSEDGDSGGNNDVDFDALIQAGEEILDQEEKFLSDDNDDDEEEDSDRILSPWHELWKALPLLESQRAVMKHERGFTDRTIEEMGYRTASPGNKEIIERLIEKWLTEKTYTAEELIHHGVAVRNQSGSLAAPIKFCGKIKHPWATHPNGKPVLINGNNILIPYFRYHTPKNQKKKKGKSKRIAECFMLRPHKDNLPSRSNKYLYDFEADENPEDVGVTFPYGEHIIELLHKPNFKVDHLVITEGEFKAAALFQCGIPAIAIPGITMASGRSGARFRSILRELLRRRHIKSATIIFDNETKEYIAFEKRFEVQIYTEFLAHALRSTVYAKIGTLPDDMRRKGSKQRCTNKTRPTSEQAASETVHFEKTDFDQILAEQGTEKARQIFKSTMKTARYPEQTIDLFPNDAQRLMRARLNRMLVQLDREENPQRKLFMGEGRGGIEERKARVLRGIQGNEYHQSGEEISRAFLDCANCFYRRKPPHDKLQAKLRSDIQKFKEKIAEIEQEGGKESTALWLRQHCDLKKELLKGIPEKCSNFRLEGKFVVVEPAGEHRYMLLILPADEKTGPHTVILTSSQLSSAQRFREGLSQFCPVTWATGDNELQQLRQDIDREVAYNKVHQLYGWGFHHEMAGGLFIADNVAITPDDRVLAPDDFGNFWYEGAGYRARMDTMSGTERTGKATGYPLGACIMQQAPSFEDAGGILIEYTELLRQIVGEDTAFMMLGHCFQFLFLEKFMATNKPFAPGMMIHGTTGDGKSTIMESLFSFWGFLKRRGLRMTGKGMTVPVLARAFSQHSGIMLFLDEWRFRKGDDKSAEFEDMLRNAGDLGSRTISDHMNRQRTIEVEFHTQATVCGETMFDDPAVRNRVLTIHLNRALRSPDPEKQRYLRWWDLTDQLSGVMRILIGRRRSAYDQWQQHYDDFREAAISIITEDRQLSVYAITYASYVSTFEILNVYLPHSTIDSFMEFCLDHATKSKHTTTEDRWSDRWWQDLFNFVQTGRIRHKDRWFELVWIQKDEDSDSWQDKEMIDGRELPYTGHLGMRVYGSALFSEYEIALRQKNESAPLSLKNLCVELATHRSWLTIKGGSQRRKSDDDGRSKRVRYWLIDLHTFPYADLVHLCLAPESKNNSEGAMALSDVEIANGDPQKYALLKQLADDLS